MVEHKNSYLPNGVMKIVNKHKFLAIGIYLLAFSFVHLRAELMFLLRVAGDDTLSKHSFKCFRSTQYLIFPDGLGTTTMLAHHRVGLQTGEMTPRDSIHLVHFERCSLKAEICY